MEARDSIIGARSRSEEAGRARTKLSPSGSGRGIVRAGTTVPEGQRLCYRTAMPVEEAKIVTESSVSARIIAAGIVIAFLYWASSVLVTLIVSVSLAYFLDPMVTWMESWHVPRALGSLLVVLLSLALLMIIVWTLVDRVDQFGRDWPSYRAPLRAAANVVSKKLESFEAHVSEIEPGGDRAGQRIVEVAESHP